MTERPTCWAISDGAAGNERQALALAGALGLAPRVLRIRIAEPWNALAPRLLAGARLAIRDHAGGAITAPWPDLAIGCGRRAALLTRALRRWSDARTWTVQILDPRVATDAWDLVVAPRHDRVQGDNVLASIGALNPVDPEWLARGRAQFPLLGTLPSPRTTLLVGASTRAQRLDAAYFDALLERLTAQQARDGGSVLASVSRRTPPAIAARLRVALGAFPGTFWAGAADGANPYAGLLGWADRLVVTPDSVNMLSEACATGRPVRTFAPRPIAGKLAAFHAELVASGHLRDLDDDTPRAPAPALAETAAIAELVARRWRM